MAVGCSLNLQVACTNWKRVLFVLTQRKPYPDPMSLPAEFIHNSVNFTLLSSFPKAEMKVSLCGDFRSIFKVTKCTRTSHPNWIKCFCWCLYIFGPVNFEFTLCTYKIFQYLFTCHLRELCLCVYLETVLLMVVYSPARLFLNLSTRLRLHCYEQTPLLYSAEQDLLPLFTFFFPPYKHLNTTRLDWFI